PSTAQARKRAPRRPIAPKRESGEIRRDQVAESALSLIAEGGIHAVTPRAVARLLRVPARRLERAYPTVTSILTALLDYVEEQLVEHVRPVGAGDTDAIGRLERLVVQSCDAVRGDARLLSAAFATALAVGNRHRRIRERLLSILMSYLKDVTDIVREGQRNGQIRNDVDAGIVALMYLGLVQSAAMLSHASGGDFNLRTT